MADAFTFLISRVFFARPTIAVLTVPTLAVLFLAGPDALPWPAWLAWAAYSALAARVCWLRLRAGRGGAPWDGNDLSAWHPAHRDPAGDVWAVTPPCGHGEWALYAPGSPTGGPYPYLTAWESATHPAAAEFGGDDDRLTLADVEAWMRPWVERVAGRPVLEMAEGWGTPYGEGGDLYEYVIYARVAGAGQGGGA